MDRLIWQPDCYECEQVRQRLLKRPGVALVTSNFPFTFPHEKHAFTIIREGGVAVTGDAADALVRRWTRPAHGSGVALALAMTSAVTIGFLFLCAVGVLFG